MIRAAFLPFLPFLPLLHTLAIGPAYGQSKSMTLGPNRMELTLERQTKTGWKVVDPGLIFNSGEHVRFRFRANFSGFVYVMNQGTGGTYTKLFPREDTGMMNRIEAGRDYIVPATDGAFRIEGPPGQDIIYWMVTPVSIGGDRHTQTPLPPLPSAVPTSSKPLGTMTPRCDDTVLRARGDCVDTSAGPQAVADGSQVPENLKELHRRNSQPLVFMKDQNKSVVASSVPLTGPVIYEFRLAHK